MRRLAAEAAPKGCAHAHPAERAPPGHPVGSGLDDPRRRVSWRSAARLFRRGLNRPRSAARRPKSLGNCVQAANRLPATHVLASFLYSESGYLPMRGVFSMDERALLLLGILRAQSQHG